MSPAVKEGVVHRIRPKIMTVSVILLGLLPIMWSPVSVATHQKQSSHWFQTRRICRYARFPLNCGMTSARLFLSLLLLGGMFNASALAQMSNRESKRIEQGKITKNEAQHLVMRRYPGAQIKNCELRQGKKHSVWLLDVVLPANGGARKVEVDGRTGKILDSPQQTKSAPVHSSR